MSDNPEALVYLVRHGEAKPKDEDPDRPLSAAGRDDVSRMADWAAEAGVSVTAIQHSGKLRAGRRVGFEAIGLGGQSTTLAYVASKSKVRVGRYGVELVGFEQLINEELKSDADVDLFVVDEIGKMECFSRRFVELVTKLLENRSPVVATVAMKGGGLIQEVKQRRDAKVITVSSGNRDDLVEALVERIA